VAKGEDTDLWAWGMKSLERTEEQVVARGGGYGPVGYEEPSGGGRYAPGGVGGGKGGNTDLWGMKSPKRAEERLVGEYRLVAY
jgi:hypothetical protein